MEEHGSVLIACVHVCLVSRINLLPTICSWQTMKPRPDDWYESALLNHYAQSCQSKAPATAVLSPSIKSTCNPFAILVRTLPEAPTSPLDPFVLSAVQTVMALMLALSNNSAFPTRPLLCSVLSTTHRLDTLISPGPNACAAMRSADLRFLCCVLAVGTACNRGFRPQLQGG